MTEQTVQDPRPPEGARRADDSEDAARRVPPLPLRLLGWSLSFLIARIPGSWPLLRRGTRAWWDRMAPYWQDRIKPDAPEHLAPLAAACEHLPDLPKRILELGTGTGSGARMLARRFPEAEIYAVDISPAMLQEAQAKTSKESDSRIHFGVADAGALPYEDGSFDLIAQLNLPVYFDETARVLSRGGHIVVASSLGTTTPYYTSERLLRRSFERRGVQTVATGSAGDGTFFVARRS
jgi:SAM-dependent methyltransferase